MLAAKGMLKSLADSENTDDYKAYNDDQDFSKVLEVLKDTHDCNYDIICSDGQKRNLFFND